MNFSSSSKWLLPWALITAVLCPRLGSALSSAELFVRVWEGRRQSDVTGDTFQRYLEQVLFPNTITANDISLSAYIPVVLDFDAPMPPDAFLKEPPFHEAALVVHQSEELYNQARKVNPWYGPLHFVKGGGFDETNSFSGVPASLQGTMEITTREKRVSYDLRAGSGPTPDWQKGNVIVSVLLRRAGTSDEEFKVAATAYSQEVRSTLGSALNGHFVRLGPGHVLEYLNVPDSQKWEETLKQLEAVTQKYSTTLIGNYFRKFAVPVPHGQAPARKDLAINIGFHRVGVDSCEGALL
jgi:hypothetical protein